MAALEIERMSLLNKTVDQGKTQQDVQNQAFYRCRKALNRIITKTFGKAALPHVVSFGRFGYYIVLRQ